MKHSKFLFGAGTLLLAVGGVLAGRASAKFTNLSHVYFSTTGTAHHCVTMSGLPGSGNLIFTTNGTLTNQATIKTSGGGGIKLYGDNTCSTDDVVAHFKV
jgi:hypothetical protein